MKLAFALFVYFPHGGLTRDLIAIARACRRREHEIRVYAFECRGIVDDELDVCLLPPTARTNHGRSREFSEKLKTAIAEFSPDLLVGFNKMPGLDVYYAADGCFADKTRQRAWWYHMMPRCRHFLALEKSVFARARATQIYMIAENQVRAYQECYDTPRERITLLPPGIARDRVAGDDASARRKFFREKWQLDDEDKLLLVVGSGFRTKGLDRALRAFASLPAHWLDRARLFVVGNDKAAPFEKIAQRLGIHSKVRFLNGRDDVPEFLLGADLLVHPAYRENTGTVLLEAMVAGLPVVTTDVCGYAHYVSDEGMGEVLPSPFDQLALNRSLLRLMEMERDIWQERGRNFADKADIYDMPLHACRRLEEIAEQTKSQAR